MKPQLPPEDGPKANLDELALRAKAGDEEAFSALYSELLTPVYRFVYFRVPRQQDAEDLTSEIFFRVLRGLPNFQQRAGVPFAAWVFRLARNAVIDFHRAKKEVVEIPEDTPELRTTGHTPARAESALEHQRLRKALDKLPPTQGLVVSLSYLAERSTAEIANMLGRSETAVRLLRFRGLARLRRHFPTDTADE